MPTSKETPKIYVIGVGMTKVKKNFHPFIDVLCLNFVIFDIKKSYLKLVTSFSLLISF